jgi:hypothetical protein
MPFVGDTEAWALSVCVFWAMAWETATDAGAHPEALALCPPHALLGAPSLGAAAHADAPPCDERRAVAEVLRAHNDTDAQVHAAMRVRFAELTQRYASHVRSCGVCASVDLAYSPVAPPSP